MKENYCTCKIFKCFLKRKKENIPYRNSECCNLPEKKKVYKQMINIYHLFYHYLFQSRFQSLLSLFWGFLLKQKSVKGSVLNLVAVFSSVIKKYTDWTQPASFLCFFLQFVTLSWTSWVIPSAHVEEPSSTVRILLSN